MHVISSRGGTIGGTLSLGVDDEGDAGVVESSERVVEVDGNAVRDAGCQPQNPGAGRDGVS
jgi:hypothetical protein